MRNHSTLKDIAAACGVSPTVASAALRNKKGRIRYSARLQEEILKKAAELNYRPNRIARGMVLGKPLFIAMALHQERVEVEKVNYYILDTLPPAAFALRQHGYEMIYLPYADADEQMRRLKELQEERVVGGIITNYVSGSETRLGEFLESSRCPYVVLGDLKDNDLVHAHIDGGLVEDTLDKLAVRMGLKARRSFGMSNGVLMARENGIWRAVPDRAAPLLSSDVLCCANGIDCARHLMEERGVDPIRLIVVDDFRAPIVHKPTLHLRNPRQKLMELCVDFIAGWLETEKRPAGGIPVVHVKNEDIRLIT